MFFKYASLLWLCTLAHFAAADTVTFNPPKQLSDVMRCSEKQFAKDIVKAFRIGQTAGEITFKRYADQMNQYGLRHCNRIEKKRGWFVLIGQIETGVEQHQTRNRTMLVIAEVRLGLFPEDVDDVGFIIMTIEQYEELFKDML